MSQAGGSGCVEARAIPFITQQASGALAIEAEAATFLRSVEPPVCVLAVVGMHRTGKSFLMNSLLLSQSQQSEGCVRGFKVGNGLNTCTKGVWIYNQVVQMTRSDGSLARFLVLDTEGTGEAGGDDQRDVITWALTLLLSSYLVYNSMGAIDEQSISQLSLVSHVASLLHTTPDKGDASSNPPDVHELFPSFLWLVRDFSLELKSTSGELLSEEEYLERALLPVDVAHEEAASKNATRKTLLDCFRNLSCFTLVRPVIDEDLLQQLGSLDVSHTRDKFQQQLAALRRKVVLECREKRLRGAPVGGAGLLALSEAFIGAVSGADGPASSLADAYSDAAKAMAEHAFIKARQKLNSALDALPASLHALPDSELDAAVAEAARGARRSLHTHLGLSCDAVSQGVMDKLEAEISSRRRAVMADNDSKGMELVERLYREVEQGLTQGRYSSLPQFLADVARVRACCEQQVGRATLAEGMERRVLEGAKQIAAIQRELMDEAQRRVTSGEHALAAAQEQLMQLRRECEERKEEVRGLEMRCMQLEAARQAAEQVRDAAVYKAETVRQQLEQQHLARLDVEHRALARAEAQAMSLRAEVERLEARSAALDSERENAQHALAACAEEAQRTSAAMQASRERASVLEDEARAAKEEHDRVVEELRAQVQRWVAEAERAENAADARRGALEAQVAQLSERVSELREDKDKMQSILSEAMSRAGDASLVSEEHWKERLRLAQDTARTKLDEMRRANESSVAAVTRTFESEREALCLRVASLERQVADAAADAEVRRAEQASMSNEYEAAIDELERELTHSRDLVSALGGTAEMRDKMEALSRAVGDTNRSLADGNRSLGQTLAHVVASAKAAAGEPAQAVGAGGSSHSRAGGVGAGEETEVVASMSRIIAAKTAEVEDMREATDGTVLRLRALIEHKDSDNERLQRMLRVFLNHCSRVQCRYCGRDLETRSATEHVPACMARRGISSYSLLSDIPPCLAWLVEVEGTATRSCEGQAKTVYLISVRRAQQSNSHMCVARRYRDIVKLHATLRQHLPRVRLPDFKPMRGNSAGIFAPSDDLVAKRREQIGDYLRQALQLAAVADCCHMRAFLQKGQLDMHDDDQHLHDGSAKAASDLRP